MPVSATIRLEGQREMRAALRKTGDDAADLKTAHAKAAQIVEERAVDIVPILTGVLRSTVRSSGTKTRGMVRAGFARVPYAGPIHFGWARRNITPQPFLYDALDDRHDEVLETYNDQVISIATRHGLDVRAIHG